MVFQVSLESPAAASTASRPSGSEAVNRDSGRMDRQPRAVLGFPLGLSEARKALWRSVGSTAERRGWVCFGEEEMG